MNNNHRKIISVDIDGYIADNYQFSLEARTPTPRKEVIEKVNDLYRKGYTIIYHTARQPDYYRVTYAWLVDNGCLFHALRMGKMRADYYLDDRNANIDDL